ncbi:alpha-ketoglutarate-dependent dioxygenase AlkB [Aestuariibacter halophilus]|uniref:Alpha-ketoglutarate-dependent dioxygenase AlkB n=1 Tax=Fluctibacter halophilus TaxID=226011 RepID=A0ABS8GBI2_9ALTE|nr:alpha-ketoglutarate-dependent dioxygenase AlkB [Aestuariibacter halophilus]MCC2617907.1 alpha-ketoglutarate-dependent dioxygenase AlkB [Aestuariibacter halophilus]
MFATNDSSALQTLDLPDATLQYVPAFLNVRDADDHYRALCDSLNWRQDNIKMFGRTVRIPRLQAYYGDPQARYRYSGLWMLPQPWTEHLQSLRERCQSHTGQVFNAVLANWYRDGDDSMGWHSDDEPELGAQPVIASLTLGSCRDFDLRHKVTGQKIRIPLQNGSLLIMSGTTQQYWQHAVPKRKSIDNGRINLTFRRIQA